MRVREKTAEELASEAGRLLVRKRWAEATPEQRSAQGRLMRQAQLAAAERERAERDKSE